MLPGMLSAPAVFDKGQVLGFIPYVIFSSRLVGGLLTVVLTLLECDSLYFSHLDTTSAL